MTSYELPAMHAASCVALHISSAFCLPLVLLLLHVAAAVAVQRPGSAPVWRQILQLHVDLHSDREVEREAAAALRASH